MLQHYHSQIVDLHEDYKQEYARDLDFFVSKARELFKQDGPEQKDPESAGTTVAMDDVKFRQQQEAGSDNDSPDPKSSSKKSDAPEWARKLFKKIALMTHPDRIGDESSDEDVPLAEVADMQSGRSSSDSTGQARRKAQRASREKPLPSPPPSPPPTAAKATPKRTSRGRTRSPSSSASILWGKRWGKKGRKKCGDKRKTNWGKRVS